MSTVSPRPADPAVRMALIEAGARMLAEHARPTIRRLAAEVGTSTMAVYTHFGSMDQLLGEVRRAGFSRLAAHMATVPHTRDPVSDLALLGGAYCINAMTNPAMYRVMFLESTLDDADADVGVDTFMPVVQG